MMISPVKIWRNQKHITASIGRVGTVVSWTVVRVPLGTYKHMTPYVVALVQFDKDERKLLQIVNTRPEEIRSGDKVAIVLRRITAGSGDGVVPYGIKGNIVRASSVGRRDAD